MIRELLIRILFRLLDKKDSREYQDIDDKRIEKWLQMQYSDIGFRDYWRKSDYAVLKTIGNGVPTKDYPQYLGERFRLMKIIQDVNEAHKRAEKQKEIEAKKLAAQRSKQQNQNNQDKK